MPSVLRTPEQLTHLIRQRRKDLGLTQTDLAGRLGLSQKRVSALERRPELLSLRQLLDLTALLDIQVSIEGERGSANSTVSASNPTESPKW